MRRSVNQGGFYGTAARSLGRMRLDVAIGVLSVLMVYPSRAASPFHPNPPERSARGPQGYLGINFRDVADDQLASLKLKDAQGEEVVLVDHDGPACLAGIREHDIIVQMNGQPIESEEQLRRLLHDLPPGRHISFLISREGQQQTIAVQLADRKTIGQVAWGRHKTVPDPYASDASVPPDPASRGKGFFGSNPPTAADLPRHGALAPLVLSASYTGALLELMGPQLAEFFGTQTGLLVRAVDPDSPAAVAGMHAGDVVVRINALPIVSSADWVKAVHENKGKPLAVVVLRDKKEQVLTLVPDTKKRSSVHLPLDPLSPAVGMVRLPNLVQ